MNWPALPFVRLLLPLAAGILLGTLAISLPIPILACTYMLTLSLLFFLSRSKIPYHHRYRFGVLLFVGMLGLGFFRAYLHSPRNHLQHFSHSSETAAQWQFRVAEVKTTEKNIRLTGRVLAMADSSGQLRATMGKLLLYLRPEPNADDLRPGSILMVKTSISPLEPPKNPRAFDFAAYMSKQGIYHRSFAGAGEWVLQEIGDRKSGSRDILHSIRQFCLRVLREHLPKTQSMAVGAALIMGQRDLISEETRLAYTDTGAIHVLAVSGLHVGLIYLGLGWLLGLMGLKGRAHRWPRTVILVAAIWFFAVFTGGSASVLRAATMFSLLVFGEALYRRQNIYNTLAASAFLLLCLHPYLLFDLGFQLSYLAVAGIVFFQGRIYRSFYLPNRLADYLWKLASVSLAAQLTTLPISLFYFHQFPVYFWLSGWVVVPAAMIILSLGLLLLMLGAISPIAELLGKLLALVIDLMNQLIFGIQELPMGLISNIWLGLEIVILLYLVLLLLMQGLRDRRLGPICWALSGMILVGIWNNGRLWQAGRQLYLTVYHLYGQTAVDVFDGRQAYCITNVDADTPQLKMASENHRAFHRIDRVHYRAMKDSAFQTGAFMHRNHYLQAGHSSFFLLEKLPERAPPVPIAVDYLIVLNNADLNISELGRYFSFRQVIFDASNWRNLVDQWIEQCHSLGISFHDIGNAGAWQINLKH